MILSDRDILKNIESGKLVIKNWNPDLQLQSASVDIRLGNSFRTLNNDSGLIVSFDNEESINKAFSIEIQTDVFYLPPSGFVLATTMEYIKLAPNISSFVEGRSSIGRLGLSVQNAGWVDPGFEGEITFELYNSGSLTLELKAGQRIGQLVFAYVGTDCINPYNGKYQGQCGATSSRIFKDIELQTKKQSE